MIPVANLTYLWDGVVNPRLGCDYVWGGSFDGNDVTVGTDCSGAVSAELCAMMFGPGGMIWPRQFWTGTFAGAAPGDHGSFGGVDCTKDLVCIAHPGQAPFGAAMIIAVRQMADPADAHMICTVPTTVGGPWAVIEMGGNSGDYHTGHVAIDDPEFNQWFYLPGPIVGAGLTPTPAPGDSPLVVALKQKGFSPQLIRLIQGFSTVEGLNPAGNPTLGWTDAQLGGASDLQAHVDALAQQFKDRADVAGPFPQGGSDLDQAQWIARVVGQTGVIDWQGNQQPSDYVSRVVNAMPGPPPPTPPPPPTLPQPVGDVLTPEEHDKLLQVWGALFNPVPSKSKYAKYEPAGIETSYATKDYIPNIDEFSHESQTIRRAMNGDPKAIRLVQLCAADGDPESVNVMALIGGTPPPPTLSPLPVPIPPPTPIPAPSSNGNILGVVTDIDAMLRSFSATLTALTNKFGGTP